MYASLGGAFISGCPFRSPFSNLIRLIFEILHTVSNWILCGCLSSKRLPWLWIGTIIFFWFALNTAVAYATLISGTWSSLFLFPAAIPLAYSAQHEVVRKNHEPRAQKNRISYLALGMFLFVSLSITLGVYFEYPIFIPLYCIGVFAIAFTSWMIGKMSKSMTETGGNRCHSLVINNDTSSRSGESLPKNWSNDCQWLRFNWFSLPTQAFEIPYASPCSFYNFTSHSRTPQLRQLLCQ